MRDHYRDLPSHYYKRDHVYDFRPFFRCIDPDAYILNLGCGRAESLLTYQNAHGVDFNDSLIPLWHKLRVDDRCHIYDVADGLPWPSNEFSYTISVDFLEHVQPDSVDAVLAEVVRLAPHGRHVIDTKVESRFRGPGGENLHPSANNPAFWEEALKRAGAADYTYQLRGAFVFASW